MKTVLDHHRNHFIDSFHVCPSVCSENIRKPAFYRCFQGIQKETVGMDWANDFKYTVAINTSVATVNTFPGFRKT